MYWPPNKELLRVYSHAGIYLKLFVPYRWIVFPFVKFSKMIPVKGKIVELGCGHGIMSTFLAIQSDQRKVIGIDIQSSRINPAKETIEKQKTITNKPIFIQGDILEIEIPQAECYILVDFLHHLPSVEAQQKVLKVLGSKIPSKSKLVISDIDMSKKAKWYFGKFVEFFVYPNMATTYRSIESILKDLEDSGFDVEVSDASNWVPYSSIFIECTKR